jgi:hypothetical protein
MSAAAAAAASHHHHHLEERKRRSVLLVFAHNTGRNIAWPSIVQPPPIIPPRRHPS